MKNYNANNEIRKYDEEAEKAVTEFLEKHFYNKLNGWTYEIIDDVERQCQGIDTIISNGKISLNIDHKLKFKGCLNQILQYPSFEILTYTRYGNDMLGWFVNEKNKTHYYAFVNIWLKDIYQKVTYDNIDQAIMTCVWKNDIQNLIIQTIQRPLYNIINEARDLRDSKSTDRFNYYIDGHKVFHLKHSTQLREHPVNLVINRDMLLSLKNTKVFNVTR